MMIVLLDHILYGIASRVLVSQEGHALKITAHSSGLLGELVSVEVVYGDSLSISVLIDSTHHTITITVVEGVTTEADVIQAIKSHAEAFAIIEGSQESGDGTAIVIPHEPENLVAAKGLLQALNDEFGLSRWDDRELRTAQEMQGLLWIQRITPVSLPPVDWHRLIALVHVGLTITNKLDFTIQNSQLIQLGRRIAYMTRRFKAENLTGVAVGDTTFTNTMKPESAAQPAEPLKSALLRVAVATELQYRQPADLNPAVDPLITSIDFGLFRQPLEEEPGGPGADLVDTFTVNP